MQKRYTIVYYDAVESTMDTAYSFAKDGIDKLTLIIAKTQKKGRGRGNNYWFSPEGGFWGTFILPLGDINLIDLESLRFIHYVGTLIVITVLEELYDIELSIKWPNDIYYKEKKVGGVLIEYITGEHKHLLIGVGVNVNNSFVSTNIPTNLLKEKATSMLDITSKRIEIKDIANRILEGIDREFHKLLKKKNKVVALVNKKLGAFNKEVLLDGVKSVICKGINNQGLLVLNDKNNLVLLDIEESVRIKMFE